MSSSLRHNKIIIKLGVAAYRTLRFLVRVFPPAFSAQMLGSSLAFFGQFSRKEKTTAVAQLRYAKTQSTHTALAQTAPEDITKGVFNHLGQCIAEVMLADRLFELNPGPNPLLPWIPHFKHFIYEAPEEVRGLLENNKSYVALTAHLGNFELLAPLYTRIGFKVSVFRRSPNYPVIDAIHHDFLDWSGAEVLWRHDPRSAKKLLRCLRDDNRVIAALIDQDSNMENEFAPFFNLEAASPLAPIKIALKYKLPVCSTFIVRTSTLHHRVVIDPIDYDPEDPEASKHILSVYNKRLAALIEEYPEQWLWWHRRWRRRPNVDYHKQKEALRGTKDYLQWITEQQAASEAKEFASRVENG